MLPKTLSSRSLFTRLTYAFGLPLLAISALVILIATLYPYRPDLSRIGSLGDILDLVRQSLRRQSGLDDRWNNVVLFLPLGFSLASLIAPRGQRMLWLYGCIAAGAFSLAIEMFQATLPTRAPTIVDVFTNTVGAMVGMAAYLVLERICTTRIRLLSLVCLVVLGALLLIVPLQRAARMTNWEDSHTFALGDDPNGMEPWAGSIKQIGLRIEPASPLPAQDDQSWLAFYDFTSAEPLQDQTGQQGELVAQRGSATIDPSQGLILNHDNAIQLPNSAELVEAYQHEGQLTVMLVAATADLEQNGALISLAEDADHMNFSAVQDHDMLIVQLRTRATGEHGLPALRIPGAFTDTQPHTYVIRYDQSVLSLSIDGVEHPERVVITPGLALISQILPYRANVVLDRYDWAPIIYNLLFELLIMLPWGLALAIIAMPLREQRSQIMAVVGGAVLMAALSSLIMVLSGGTWPNILISLVGIIAAVGFALLIRPLLQPESAAAVATATPPDQISALR